MKKLLLLLFTIISSLFIFFLLNGCSKSKEITEPPVDEPFKTNFSNDSYGCATIKITDSNGQLFSKTTEHGKTDTGSFTTLDSVVTVSVNSSPFFRGIMFNIYDGSNNRLGSVDKSGTSSGSTIIKLPKDGIIKVSLFFYNPCPIPDEPGCPVPPAKPYSCS